MDGAESLKFSHSCRCAGIWPIVRRFETNFGLVCKCRNVGDRSPSDAAPHAKRA